MEPKQVAQAALFYEFDLERRVPVDHILRQIDRFVDLLDIQTVLAPYYSSIGRPSLDPELMIRMLVVGYCVGMKHIIRIATGDEFFTVREYFQSQQQIRW